MGDLEFSTLGHLKTFSRSAFYDTRGSPMMAENKNILELSKFSLCFFGLFFLQALQFISFKAPIAAKNRTW